MEATEVDWDEMEATHLEYAMMEERVPRSLHHRDSARENLWNLVGHLRKCPKRKVCPSHSAPAELLLMALRPNYLAKRKQPGIGMDEDPKLQAKECAWMYEEAYRKINQTRLTPLRWHRSWGAALQKTVK